MSDDVSLDKHGIYLLMGSISTETVQPVIDFILKNEFYEAYTQMFQNSFNQLRRILRIKLKAI